MLRPNDGSMRSLAPNHSDVAPAGPTYTTDTLISEQSKGR